MTVVEFAVGSMRIFEKFQKLFGFSEMTQEHPRFENCCTADAMAQRQYYTIQK